MIATLSIMVEFERMVIFVDKDKIEKASQAVEDLGLEDKIRQRNFPKTHWLDAVCVGESTPEDLRLNNVRPLLIKATGSDYGYQYTC